MQNKRKHNENKLRQKHMYRVYRYVVDSLKCYPSVMAVSCKMHSCKFPSNYFSTFFKKFALGSKPLDSFRES